MAIYNLPNFSELDLDDLDDYYDAQVTLGEQKVALDLNFEEYSISQRKMDTVKSMIDDLPLYNNKALMAIKEEYSSGNVVKGYFTQHFNLPDHDESTLSKLYLKRVGFYPENETGFAVFDYTINEDITRYLIVVNFKENGDIDSITIEN